MDWKKLGHRLLFPHIAIALILLPVSTALLVYAMVVLGTQSIAAIVSYVLSAYTLTVWCFRIPWLIRVFQTFRRENKYWLRWRADDRLRVNTGLQTGLLFNTAYAVFHLCLGFWHRSFWFFSLAGYYVFLAALRLYLLRYSRGHAPGEDMRAEQKKYRTCGIVFLPMNLFLALIVFFMVYWNRTFRHHQITTIAMAAYTFSSLSMAMVNVVRYRKFGSPLFAASRAISMTAAFVSMLTLSSTMLTTFGNGTMSLAGRRIILGLCGGAVCALVMAIAVYMIIKSSKFLKE